MATSSQGFADRGVELPAFDVGGAYDQHALSRLVRDGVLLSDLVMALADIRYLASAMLLIEERERIGDFARRGKPNRLAQLWVALAADGFQPSNSHSSLLHLIDWPSGLDGVMLMLVADEDNALDSCLVSFA